MTAPRPVRVLIVDDNADIRRLVRLKLELAGGFEILPDAADGASALVAAGDQLPDVVLLDLSMPVMDGLEALPQMRQVLPYGRIVMLSGFDSERFRMRAIELGADEYVEKGSALDDLVDLVRSLSTVLPKARDPLPEESAAPAPAPVPAPAPALQTTERTTGAA